MEVFVVSPEFKFLVVSVPHKSSITDLIRIFSTEQGVCAADLYVKQDGRRSDSDALLQAGALYRLEPRLCGGKGGFGSMLRALGAQIEKTTNREACRDLSGRRLRDVNHEKEMAEWLKQQAERDAGREQRRLERIQRKLAEPKHQFSDADYEQQCHDLSERLEDSVLKGMQASCGAVVQADEGPSRKRPAEQNSVASPKRNCYWTGLEDLEDMDSSDGDTDDGEPGPSSSSSSSVPGLSCVCSESAAVLTATTRQRDGAEFEDLSSSSSMNSVPCSAQNNLETQRVEEGEEEEAGAEPLEEEKEVGLIKEIKQDSDEQEVEKVVTEMKSIKGTLQSSPQLGCAGDLELLSVSRVEDLEPLGLERLKLELMKRGLKCGGTLQERSARLFSIRGLRDDQIDPALLSKACKSKKK